MGIIPFLLMDFLTLGVLIVFPQISLFLPSLMVVS
jgi:TRAP-type mannitol/chloroaromatic compound transport system permease large subunit